MLFDLLYVVPPVSMYSQLRFDCVSQAKLRNYTETTSGYKLCHYVPLSSTGGFNLMAPACSKNNHFQYKIM